MKKFLGPVLGACLIASVPAGTAAQPAPAAKTDPAEIAEAQAIIEIMFPPAARQKMFDDMLVTLTAQLRAGAFAEMPADPGVKAILSEFLDRTVEAQRPLIHKHMPSLLAAMATAYSNEFTLAELKDIRAFALTPSGGHYLSRSLAMVGDPAVAKVNAAMIADAQKLSLSMRDELKAKLLAYLAEHPEAMEKPKPGSK